MKTQRQNYFSRSHLLRMAMLSQRAVDYSIKAHDLGAQEVYRLFWKYDLEWRKLQCSIGDRGRRLIVPGMPVDADSTIADSALRIYGALYVTYTAACEIAHIGSLMVECKRTTPSPCLEEIARFINGLVRLCTVALFKKEVQHARMILSNDGDRRRCELALYRTCHLLMQNPSTHAGFQLAVARALGQIADQAYEIAEASILWLEGDNRRGSKRERPGFAA
jgi:phosphate uptake regulator